MRAHTSFPAAAVSAVALALTVLPAGNASAGTANQADAIRPRLAAEHFNTVLVPQ